MRDPEMSVHGDKPFDNKGLRDGQQRLRAYVLVGVGLVSLAIAWNGITSDRFWRDGGGDYAHYSRAAVEGSRAIPAPWRYRVLFTGLAESASAMGMPAPVAFLVVTACAATLGCAVFGFFLEGLGFNHRTACLGVGVFASSCGGWMAVRGYGYPDAVANLFLIWALLCLVRSQFAKAGCIIAVGVLAKESLLLLVPLGVLAGIREGRLRDASVLALLPAATYLGVRYVVGRGVDEYGFFSLQNIEGVLGYWRNTMTDGPIRWVVWAAVYSFGPLWILAALGMRNGRMYVLNTLPYWGALLLPLALTTDTDRVLSLFFPVVIPLALLGAEEVSGKRWIVSASGIVLVVVLCQATFAWTASVKTVAVGFLCIAPVGLLLAVGTGRENRSIETRNRWCGPGRVW
jgi:hypothetical protein